MAATTEFALGLFDLRLRLDKDLLLAGGELALLGLEPCQEVGALLLQAQNFIFQVEPGG